jgi:hypothetical protein
MREFVEKKWNNDRQDFLVLHESAWFEKPPLGCGVIFI